MVWGPLGYRLLSPSAWQRLLHCCKAHDGGQEERACSPKAQQLRGVRSREGCSQHQDERHKE
eukprot:CAMPEP_0202351874 /NCGR_PEP_ID=MMETSP1126-20121109/8317_1 /ASSEMBLY_ACC=CAM_ASM_000457 /TAXON_ID=3047 /ORGANISM="Dunaliella tertiolecta, Strain CCMP1320" /LENGTH=61 /DNA_ID=CAMNT_0048944023 /DNA_START=584 /DNA_END=766 /DNA_ORIENTATION=-